MRVIIVRHGETEENIKEILQGQKTPGTLSQKGIEQARKVALRLRNEPIEKAFVSDLKRAVDTAKEILKYHPAAKVVYEPLLRERSFGVFDGQPGQEWIEARERYGRNVKPEGGESEDDVKKRVIEFFHRVLEREKSSCILIVSHGGTITHFLLHLFGKNLDEFEAYHPKHTAVTILEVKLPGGQHAVHALNCTKHLAEPERAKTSRRSRRCLAEEA